MPCYNAAMKSYRYLDLIMALFVAVLLISNVASAKILDLGPFTFDGGTILFPLSYIFGDMLTEVYGYRRTRRVIWTGFGCAALMAARLCLVGRCRPPPAGRTRPPTTPSWAGRRASSWAACSATGPARSATPPFWPA